MKYLKQFPILHRFYVQVLNISEINNLDNEQLLNHTQNYIVTDKCRCGDKDCATIYMQSNEIITAEICEILSYDEAFIILHAQKDKYLELEALSSTKYPYVKEFIDIFDNNKVSTCSDCNAQKIVLDFFEELEKDTINEIILK